MIISKPIVEENIRKMHDDIAKLGIGFRPHTKTLKVCNTAPFVPPSFVLTYSVRLLK